MFFLKGIFMKSSILIVSVFPDGRLDTVNASVYLGLSQKTLAMMRSSGKGPKFIKRGRIFYYKNDLDEWLNAGGKAISTSQVKVRDR